MTTLYKDQWGTLFVLYRARKPMTSKQVVDLFGPVLAKAYGTTQKPALWTKRITFEKRMDFVNEVATFDGYAKPYTVSGATGGMDIEFDRLRLDRMQAGEPDPAALKVLHAVKWNVRHRDKHAVTKDDGLAVRSALNTLFTSRRGKLRLDYVDFEPYGIVSKFAPKGMPVPKTPALPPAPRRKAPPPVPPDYPVAKKGSPWGWILLAIGAAKALSGKG